MLLYLVLFSALIGMSNAESVEVQDPGKAARGLLNHFCLDCHDHDAAKGQFNLEQHLGKLSFDATLPFERIITHDMPPPGKPQPNPKERQLMLNYLANQQVEEPAPSSRRLNRHEFMHAACDLLGISVDLSNLLPPDKGPFAFDTNRRIQPTQNWMALIFKITDQLLDWALPEEGFAIEQEWGLTRILDSHPTYDIYTRSTKEGMIFSWTRANNGNNYAYFYSDFQTPVRGWYEVEVNAQQLGHFEGEVTIELFAGRYYFADDRPQPQRLIGVVSLNGNHPSNTPLRVLLDEGDQLSVHCHSPENFREKAPTRGALIRHLRVRGPILDHWPPRSFTQVLGGLKLEAPHRITRAVPHARSNLETLGGSLRGSSSESGFGVDNLLDGSNRTFWQTSPASQTAPTPHHVLIQNPNEHPINGLSYATRSGGGDQGKVTSYRVEQSKDGLQWDSVCLAEGSLDTTLSHEQVIPFHQPSNDRFLRFLITDSVESDNDSRVTVGSLDVITASPKKPIPFQRVKVVPDSKEALREVLASFANRALGESLGEEALQPYWMVVQQSLTNGDSTLTAIKAGLKAILCSPRFLLTPGEGTTKSVSLARNLARSLWLSIPDQALLDQVGNASLTREGLSQQVHRLLRDPRSRRMVHSLAGQWLGLDAFDTITPSLKLYPTYDTLLHHFLPLETERYLEHLIHENLSLDHLIASDFSFLNERLGRHYGLFGLKGQAMRKVSLPQSLHRGGLMTMGSILKMTTDGLETSPIRRGAWISQHLVGNTLSPPPPNIPALISHPENQPITLRDKIKQHTSQASCRACHQHIDPYGFALENFDASGQWRERYQLALPHSGTFQYRPEGYFKARNEVESSGFLEQQSFDGIDELQGLLLSDLSKVVYHFARMWFEYVSGDQPSLKQRLDLMRIIPENPAEARIADVMSDILLQVLLPEP